MLNPSVYTTHLPVKFHHVRHSAPLDEREVVVVHSSGELKVELRENFFFHDSQWTHFNGTGGYQADEEYVPDFAATRDQSAGRRWSWVPWTREMENSCGVLKIRLRGWNVVGAEEKVKTTAKGKAKSTAEERFEGSRRSKKFRSDQSCI
jgi:hypothetical protein